MEKTFIITLILSMIYVQANAKKTDSLTDPRDGKTYKTVKIGRQVWIAENLAYKPDSGIYWAYDNDQNNVAKYGYLYDWKTANKVCPKGWHLPSDDEWKTLEIHIGMSKKTGELNRWLGKEGRKLKAINGWVEDANSTDKYGFCGTPGGERYPNGSFGGIGVFGIWWSATSEESGIIWCRSLIYNATYVDRTGEEENCGCSIRCIKNL